jgi:hypothetical protein
VSLASRKYHCADCKEPLTTGKNYGLCSGCKGFSSFLLRLHHQDIDKHPELVMIRSARVEEYRKLVDAGIRLFEPTPQSDQGKAM